MGGSGTLPALKICRFSGGETASTEVALKRSGESQKEAFKWRARFIPSVYNIAKPRPWWWRHPFSLLSRRWCGYRERVRVRWARGPAIYAMGECQPAGFRALVARSLPAARLSGSRA